MQSPTPAPTRGQILSMVPVTEAKYGVIFGRGGRFDYDVEMPVVRNRQPKTLALAILQVLQYEEHFRHMDVSGHLIDLETDQEIMFSRQAPYNLLVPVDFFTWYEPSVN